MPGGELPEPDPKPPKKPPLPDGGRPAPETEPPVEGE